MFPPGVIVPRDPALEDSEDWKLRTRWTRTDEMDYVATAAGCQTPHRAGASGFLSILPQLGEQAVYDAYNRSHRACAASNRTAVGRVVSGYLHPGNPRGTGRVSNDVLPGPAGPLDYGLNVGANAVLSPGVTGGMHAGIEPDLPLSYEYQLGIGPFNVNSGYSARWLRDGAANTFLAGEMLGGPQWIDPVTGRSVDQTWAQDHIHCVADTGTGSVFAATGHDIWYTEPNFTPAPRSNLVAPWTAVPPTAGGGDALATRYPHGYADGQLTGAAGSLLAGRPITTHERALLFDVDPEMAEAQLVAPAPMLPVTATGFRGRRDGVHMATGDGGVRFWRTDVDPATRTGFGSITGMELRDCCE